eukprot:SRR837773.805.p1 GENE.SRR837773.805~~SRR837773.805.p1  ORF type:complete len:100 (-),score=33.32 SRR837773.805:50-349(-)
MPLTITKRDGLTVLTDGQTSAEINLETKQGGRYEGVMKQRGYPNDGRIHLKKEGEEDEEEDEKAESELTPDAAATRIEACYRGHRDRQKVKAMREAQGR